MNSRPKDDFFKAFSEPYSLIYIPEPSTSWQTVRRLAIFGGPWSLVFVAGTWMRFLQRSCQTIWWRKTAAQAQRTARIKRGNRLVFSGKRTHQRSGPGEIKFATPAKHLDAFWWTIQVFAPLSKVSGVQWKAHGRLGDSERLEVSIQKARMEARTKRPWLVARNRRCAHRKICQ